MNVHEYSMSSHKSIPIVNKSSLVINFTTAGIGGNFAWLFVHPFNTAAIRMNLVTTSNHTGNAPSFLSFLRQTIREKGFSSLYAGIEAGLVRQTFYATSRVGLFEVVRDEIAKYRKTDIWSRLLTGVLSGGMAALISCPSEVTLVRMSNDATLPIENRRNYSGIFNAFSRILKEEGISAFFRGSSPFVTRACLVGAVQLGSYDMFREKFTQIGITNTTLNVFYASMCSGFIYSVITMPFETTKNRMAFQKIDVTTGKLPYTSTIQTIFKISSSEGILKLFSGFSPYYLRCGGHSVIMFMTVESLRQLLI